jgi:hypothetical protein
MYQSHLILRAAVLIVTAVALGASGASAMPIQRVSGPAASSVLSPDRVDAAAHAATIRGIGAALLARADS